MKIKDINTISTKFFERNVELFRENAGRMSAGTIRVKLRGERQPPLSPLGFTSECFLFPTDVGTRSINLIVPSRLKVI